MSGMDDYLGEREVTSADEMEAWGREIGSRLRAGDLVVLTGPLGAGKTTLTRGSAPASASADRSRVRPSSSHAPTPRSSTVRR